MGRIAEVLAVEADGDIKVDLGGDDTAVADHFADSGEDSPPLPGDSTALDDGARAGTQQVTGYHDPNNDSQAQPGEKRTYARDAAGVVVAEIWAKGNGDITITSLAEGGTINLNGVVIDQDGNVTAPGEVTAKVGVSQVTLTGLKVPSPLGPLGPPLPGDGVPPPE